MSILVYVTDKCAADARTHGLADELKKFRERVESSQSISLFDPFPPPYLVKKKLGGRQIRLIASIHAVSDHAVIVFLEILMRGKQAYENFTHDPRSYGEMRLNNLVSEDALESIVRDFMTEPHAPEAPAPNATESALLHGAFSHHSDSPMDDMVFETREWVEAVAAASLAKWLVLLCKPCLSSLYLPEGLHLVAVPDRPGWGIWALRTHERLILVSLDTGSNSSSTQRFAANFEAKLNGADDVSVLRACRRVYPALVLADDELWLDIESDSLANMALSPEESEVLDSARRSSHPFPLFINGRAGSGKSTILHYIFADLLFYYLTDVTAQQGTDSEQVMAPPIYLTANGELLRIARNFVYRLLQSGAAFVAKSGSVISVENHHVLDLSFREFHPYLLSLISAEDRDQRFLQSRRVDYGRFRQLWMDRFGKEQQALREFGPDISWHVIRTYIKGMSSETFLDPGDYLQLPENQITVTVVAFTAVYERVWMGWYRDVLEEERLWDDQDLTRHVLDEDLAHPLFPAVFCDEAQDFTRLELELLLRISLFSNRTLLPYQISRVPFAFAGDQFQTLNPTGFRWDTIKTSFVEKFLLGLDPARRSGRTDLNYRELEFNYRSTRSIARFGNHVQALRAALFQLPDLRPQRPWVIDGDSFPVTSFYANDAHFWNSLRDSQDYVIIVPCAEGEEADFVRTDAVLREHIIFEDDVPRNVLSAGRAKGCEYPAVVVYGFGDACAIDIVSQIESEDMSITVDPDRSLPLQYFVNRLYVAVSRAKRRLVIVDSNKGFERLWKFARDEESEQSLLRKIKNGHPIWEAAIEGMTIGHPQDIGHDSDSDPWEKAAALEIEGIARRDGFLLKQAAQTYRSLGDPAKARECRARSLEFESAFLEAGQLFFDAGFAVPEGVRCLWQARRDGWFGLCDRAIDFTQIATAIEYRWARVLVSEPSMLSAAELLDDLSLRLGDDMSFALSCAGDLAWHDAIEALLAPLVPMQDGPENETSLMRIVTSLDRIRQARVPVPHRLCAQLYYSARRFDSAIEQWERSVSPYPIEYNIAKACMEPYPSRLLALSKWDSWGEIVRNYGETPGVRLSIEQAEAVVVAMYLCGRRDDALKIAWGSGSAQPMLSLALRAIRKDDGEMALLAGEAGVDLWVRHASWDPITRFVSTRKFAPTSEWGLDDARRWTDANLDGLFIELVRALARSTELLSAPVSAQRHIAEFLRGFLRVRDGEWQDVLGFKEAGAALERAGRFTDGIAFYEAIAREMSDTDDRQYALVRRLVCKQRQLEHEQEHGSKGRVTILERDLRLEMQRARMTGLDGIAKYPVLEPISLSRYRDSLSLGITEHMDGAADVIVGIEGRSEEVGVVETHVIGALRIEVSRKTDRCIITNTETFDTLMLSIRVGTCEGTVPCRQIADRQWKCDAWNIEVLFADDNERVLLITQLGSGEELSIWS